MLDDGRGIVSDFDGFAKESGEERRTVKISVPDYLRSKHWLNDFLRCWFIERIHTVKLRVYNIRL